jgi:SH3 domain protein
LARAAAAVLLAASLAMAGWVVGGASPAAAETGWVRSEIRLNVRTGPGTQYRIVGVAKTGDGVDVLQRADNWTKIRIEDDAGKTKTGWIPEGYLKPEPPPTIRLAHAEAEVISLNTELSSIKEETEKLRSDNEILTSQDGDQQGQIKQLTMENMELRAGARYPEWITGASIFAAGMLLGAMLHRNSARRQPTRIRL